MTPSQDSLLLSKIAEEDKKLTDKYWDRMQIQFGLSRQLVSFQASKVRPVDRWYKYKEAFSAALIEHLFALYGFTNGKLLDPFAGSGTALFVGSRLGMEADGIELLRIGQEIIATRLLLQSDKTATYCNRLANWHKARPWKSVATCQPLPTLRITEGAYPAETQESIERYLTALCQESEEVQRILRFALLCILESISYTRKDGQYLRWDYRSARRQAEKPFDKGLIPSFEEAICAKLTEILTDSQPSVIGNNLFDTERVAPGKVRLLPGSCLDILPTVPPAHYDCITTSPPYCNRYDYTRTYALELALLGVGTRELIALRQEMLICTVENRAKDLLKINPAWQNAISITDKQELLQTILVYLEEEKRSGRINNTGIPRMVRGYFYEMACVIAECARVLKPGGILFLVNDNVRYSGASISVDLILSAIAEQLGFVTEKIDVLPNGKGNSSQQMGEHGRAVLRKCVYIWRKVNNDESLSDSFNVRK